MSPSLNFFFLFSSLFILLSGKIYCQDIKGIYGPVYGFNAAEYYYKLILYDEDFCLTKSRQQEKLSVTYAISGKYTVEGGRLFLQSTSYSYDSIGEYVLAKNRSKDFHECMPVKIAYDSNIIILHMNAFNDTILVKKYIQAPDSLYELLSGRYIIQYASGFDSYYSLVLMLSNPKQNELGDYGDLFYLTESITTGNEGDTYLQDIVGRYEIKEGKLYLIFTLSKSVASVYSPGLIDKAIVFIHEPFTIPVIHEITEEAVILRFIAFGKPIKIQKNINR